MRDRRRARRNPIPSSKVPRVVSCVSPLAEPGPPGVLFVTALGTLTVRQHHHEMACRQVNRLDDPHPIYLAENGSLWQGFALALPAQIAGNLGPAAQTEEEGR